MKDFLAKQLAGAKQYDRIAGFFSSSLLEVADEALEQMTPEGGETCVRVVCNSCLNLLDTVQLALAAKPMALYGDRPILILVSKPLMIQWQDELWNLLEMPS